MPGNPRPPALRTFRFWGTTLAGSLVTVLAAPASAAVQSTVLGVLVSLLAGVVVVALWRQDERERRQQQMLEALQVPIALAPHPSFFEQYSLFAKAFADLARQTDPALREFAALKLAALIEELQSLAAGKVIFSGSEAWRTAYEKLLLSPGLKRYHSVAWVRTKDYWQDQPGSQSMRLNFDLVERGMRIERVVILRGDLWPQGHLLPVTAVRKWIQEQHSHGVLLRLVREEELQQEPQLLGDFGIYSDRAVGILELDEYARTVRFTMHFDRLTLGLAWERWERLLLYSQSYSELLDRLPPAPHDH